MGLWSHVIRPAPERERRVGLSFPRLRAAAIAPHPKRGPLAFAVWIKALFTAFLPGGLELRLGDVPVGPAFLEHRPQILAQLLDSRPAEEPVTVVDLGDAKPRLEHKH